MQGTADTTPAGEGTAGKKVNTRRHELRKWEGKKSCREGSSFGEKTLFQSQMVPGDNRGSRCVQPCGKSEPGGRAEKNGDSIDVRRWQLNKKIKK